MKAMILTVLLAITSQAFAGHDQGNGGVGVLCMDSNGRQKLEVFDLVEGKALPPYLNSISVDQDYMKTAQQKIAQFSNLFPDPKVGLDLQKKLSEISKKMIPLPEKINLESTDDLGGFIKPEGCDFVQIINYRNDGDIYSDSNLWSLLDNTNKAALLVHETIYWYLRLLSTDSNRQTGQVVVRESDSHRVRRAVAYLFSNQSLETLETARAPGRVKCTNEDSDFGKSLGRTEFILTSENNRIKARFQQITGKLMVSRTEGIFDLDDGLQSFELQSLIDKGISVEFFGIPNLEKLKNEDGSISVLLKDEFAHLEYQSSFECYEYR